jgi:hypothetical protein
MRRVIQWSRALAVAGAFLLLATTGAQAYSVHVEFSGPSQSYYSAYGFTFITASGSGVAAEADLVSGSLRASASQDGTTSDTTFDANASSDFYDIRLTNDGGSPVTFGGSLHPLTLDLTVTMSDAGAGDGRVDHVVSAGIGGNINGVALPEESRLDFQYSTTWDGTVASHSPVTLQSQSDVTITQATYDALIATLALPEVTLNPRDHLSLQVFLAVRTSMITDLAYGPTGTTDGASTPAQLRLVVPRGSNIRSDDLVASWIVVPEPSLTLLVTLALVLLARAQNSSS